MYIFVYLFQVGGWSFGINYNSSYIEIVNYKSKDIKLIFYQ